MRNSEQGSDIEINHLKIKAEANHHQFYPLKRSMKNNHYKSKWKYRHVEKESIFWKLLEASLTIIENIDKKILIGDLLWAVKRNLCSYPVKFSGIADTFVNILREHRAKSNHKKVDKT